MKSIAEMIEAITEALKNAGYSDARNAYWLLIGAGIIAEDAECQ